MNRKIIVNMWVSEENAISELDRVSEIFDEYDEVTFSLNFRKQEKQPKSLLDETPKDTPTTREPLSPSRLAELVNSECTCKRLMYGNHGRECPKFELNKHKDQVKRYENAMRM